MDTKVMYRLSLTLPLCNMHMCFAYMYVQCTVRVEHLADIKFGELAQLVKSTADYKYAGSEVGDNINLTILVNVTKLPN